MAIGSHANRTQKISRRASRLLQSLFLLLIASAIGSLWLRVQRGIPDHHPPNQAVAKAIEEFRNEASPRKRPTAPQKLKKNSDNNKMDLSESPSPKKESTSERTFAEQRKSPQVKVKLKDLSCEAHGGPMDRSAAQEMVYWSDIPSDTQYISPFHPSKRKRDGKTPQRALYMVFEPDEGGWNNIRMAMETVLALAVAMGRTLVLPPVQQMYLLMNRDSKQRHQFSFADFFPLEELANEHPGLDIITMEEFLEREAMTGNLVNQTTGKVAFPPFNRTKWDNLAYPPELRKLKAYLRDVTYKALWKTFSCLAAFPASGNHKDVEILKSIQAQLLNEKIDVASFVDNPVPVNAPAIDRMRENLAKRSSICVYDEEMQMQLVVNFMCNHELHIRLLVHFYAFLFFEDWRMDLWMKRFIRDHVRYKDEIQCAAARIIQAVRERSRKHPLPGIKPGEFDSFHIRRGDFQFKETRISAEQIYLNSREELTPNATVYIATDETNREFFAPLQERYDVVFMDDFKDLLQGINTNYYGMIDQLVASQGRVFFGCWFSTFTGFITRIRGYHSVKDKLPGYEKGALPTSFYYAPITNKFALQKYVPMHHNFFPREFPTSWRDIDQGIDWLPQLLASNTTTPP